MIDPRLLRYALTLARCGSYAAAAAELGISQPALTRAVQQLESRHGVRMFDRGRSGAAVTAIGRTLLDSAAALVAHAEDLEQEWSSVAGGSGGVARFGMAPMPARALLAAVLAERMKEAPKVRNDVSVGEVDQLVQLLANGQIEFFIAADGQVESPATIAAELLGEFPVHWFVRAGHRLTQPGTRPDAEPLLMAAKGGHAMARSAGVTTRGETHIVNDFNVLVELTMRSEGILQTSPYAVASEVRSGQLQRLALEGATRARIMFYRNRRRTLSQLAADLKTAVRNRIQALESETAPRRGPDPD